jgi:hypothetical protein
MSSRPTNCLSLSNGNNNIGLIEVDGATADWSVMFRDIVILTLRLRLVKPKGRRSPTFSVSGIKKHCTSAAFKMKSGQYNVVLIFSA